MPLRVLVVAALASLCQSQFQTFLTVSCHLDSLRSRPIHLSLIEHRDQMIRRSPSTSQRTTTLLLLRLAISSLRLTSPTSIPELMVPKYSTPMAYVNDCTFANVSALIIPDSYLVWQRPRRKTGHGCAYLRFQRKYRQSHLFH